MVLWIWVDWENQRGNPFDMSNTNFVKLPEGLEDTPFKFTKNKTICSVSKNEKIGHIYSSGLVVYMWQTYL